MKSENTDKKRKRGTDPGPLVFRLGLLGFSAFVLLDTFVIPKNVISVQDLTAQAAAAEEASNEVSEDGNSAASDIISEDGDSAGTSDTISEDGDSAGTSGIISEDSDSADTSDAAVSDNASDSASDPVVTATSYTADGVQITISTERVSDTTVYVADIQLDDPSKLLSGLADNSFGQNVSDTTSDIASQAGAVLAVNGDYYGFRSTGYVMRNGYLYRSTSAGSDQEDLVVYSDGTMDIINESEVSAEELQQQGAVQIYSFGPGLVQDGAVTVDAGDEVDRATNSNPRTAIGQISEGHYVMVVSDGRTNESAGLTLQQLAQVMQDLGCVTAYNLDGGGSSTMYFNGQIVNNPVGGHGSSERKVSDIVYIAV